ncbi:MAG: DUF3822 family protein [Salibacteraceae bacterium]
MEGRKINGITPQTTYYKNGSSFDIKAASLYSATIHVDQCVVCFGISNPKTGEILNIERFELDMKISDEGLVKMLTEGKWKSILSNSSKNQFFCTESRFSLIPSAFFDVKEIKELCSPVFKVQEGEEIISHHISEIDAHIVFPFSSDLKNSIKSKIGHTEFSHQFAPLLATYNLYYLDSDKEMAFIQFNEKTFSLALFQNKRLVLFNNYNFNSFEDVVYYTYYAIEQYGFMPASISLHMGGYTPFIKEITTAFQKYTQHIYHISPKNIENLNPENSDKLINTIFDLQCG